MTDQIFCIRHMFEKTWEYNETVQHLFLDIKKAYDSVWREVLYNILIELGLPMKLVRLIKICLIETNPNGAPVTQHGTTCVRTWLRT
jgi:hypothetical protein